MLISILHHRAGNSVTVTGVAGRIDQRSASRDAVYDARGAGVRIDGSSDWSVFLLLVSR